MRKERVFIASHVLAVILTGTLLGIEEVKIGYLISWNSTEAFGFRFAGAITRALDDINNNPNILKDHRLVFVHGDSACDGTNAVGVAAYMNCAEQVAAFIGPACSASCLSSGLLSTYYKIPMISYSCSTIELTNKTVYPYFVRTKPFARGSKKWTATVIQALLKRFDWKRVCIVEAVSDIYTALALETLDMIRKSNLTLQRYVKLERTGDYMNREDYGNLVESFRYTCRGLRLCFSNKRTSFIGSPKCFRSTFLHPVQFVCNRKGQTYSYRVSLQSAMSLQRYLIVL